MSKYSSDNPSPQYWALGDMYRQMHEQGTRNASGGTKSSADTFPGGSLLQHVETVKGLISDTGSESLLDYGCGKGVLYGRSDIRLPSGEVISNIKEYWSLDDIYLFDPGVEEYSGRPGRQFDGVISTDVLEHIPEEDIDWVLKECFSYAKRFVYMNIASYPAQKILPNGWNAHITVKPPKWWEARIREASQEWEGDHYLFEISEKREGLGGWLLRKLGFGRYKVTYVKKGG